MFSLTATAKNESLLSLSSHTYTGARTYTCTHVHARTQGHTCAHAQFPTSLPHHSPCTSSSVTGCHPCGQWPLQFPKAPGKRNLFFSDLILGRAATWTSDEPILHFLSNSSQDGLPCQDQYYAFSHSSDSTVDASASSHILLKCLFSKPSFRHFTPSPCINIPAGVSIFLCGPNIILLSYSIQVWQPAYVKCCVLLILATTMRPNSVPCTWQAFTRY